MKSEVKKIERPKWVEYLNKYSELEPSKIEGKYDQDLHKYCDQLEQERDEYKLKEEIAYKAKDIAQEAHQKVVKERDGLKERMDNLESLTDDDHTVEEWIKMWVDEADGMEILAIKRGKELQALKDGIEDVLKCESNDYWREELRQLKIKK